MIFLLTPEEDFDDQMKATYQIINQLSFHPEIRAPFIHYSKCFAAIALPRLLQCEAEKKEAELTLKIFLEEPLTGTSWDNNIRDFLINNVVSQRRGSTGQAQDQGQGTQAQGSQGQGSQGQGGQVIAQQSTGSGAITNSQVDDNQHMITAANQGLQRLADLATASTEDRGEAVVSSASVVAEGARNDAAASLNKM